MTKFLEVEGIVFDLDATLVNLGGFVDWKRAHNMAVETYLECGFPEEMIRCHSDAGLFNMLNLIWDEISLSMSGTEVQRIQSRVYDTIESCEMMGVSQCQLMPGCIPTLEWLREHGVRMGVATSNSQTVAEHILESKNIRPFFSAVVGRRPELRLKPHPDQILKCFEEMGVEPRRGVVVGDSVKDMEAAKSANIYAIAIPSYFTKREAIEKTGADHIINELRELPNILSGFSQTSS